MTKGVKIGTKRGGYDVYPTTKQVIALEQYLLKGRKWVDALRVAGYGERAAKHLSKKEFRKRSGVKRYFIELDQEFTRVSGTSLSEKIVEVFSDCLESTVLVSTVDGLVETPDWKIRLKTANQLAGWFGWI